MKELTLFQKKSDRLQNSLRASIEHFRKGNDQLGLDNFLNAMADLESLLEFQHYAEGSGSKLGKITPVLRDLCGCIKNQDVVGLTDVLEYTVYPLAEQWREGCD
ncbi:MAG: hypothetical protein KGZ96_07945 [Clostridia bacterium]|jgi:hypothetical protein|nr:hypothetical protein [Clostridia bacterium]